MMQNEYFSLSPMQEYRPPAYPTRAEKPLRVTQKLPVRWAKNAAVIACIGAMSLGVLVGCTDEPQVPNVEPTPHSAENSPAARCVDGNHGLVATYAPYAENGREFDVVVRTHWGGSGAGPFYVAYLTEQEALGIIRNRLCQAGICFDSPVPNYVAKAGTDGSRASARLSLFDERTRQGIVFPNVSWDEVGCWSLPHEETEAALWRDFAERFDVSATLMFNPGESIGDYDWNLEADPTFTDEEKQEVAPFLEQELLVRVDAFIAQLRADGILPHEQEEVRP